MRRLLVTLACVVLALPALCQESPIKPVPWANKFFAGKTDSPPPVILHDFGTLPKGTVQTYRFKMKNIYAYPVNVSEPKINCNCASIVTWTGKMEPHETGEILVKMETTHFTGAKAIGFKVRFDMRDPKTNEAFFSFAELEVRAVSRPDIAVNPGAIQFGTVPAGQKASQAVSILYSGRQRDWKITEYGGYNKSALDVTVEPVRGQAAYKVTATVKADAPPGAVDEQIVFKTNDKESPILSLTVSGEVQAPLSIVGAPGNVLKMGGVEVGKKTVKQVIVRADKAFKVTKISGEGDGLTTPLIPLEANTSQVVTVVFEPKNAGPIKKELTVTTSNGESIVLTVEGVGTEPKQ